MEADLEIRACAHRDVTGHDLGRHHPKLWRLRYRESLGRQAREAPVLDADYG